MKRLLPGLVLASCAALTAQAETVTIHTPMGYQIMDVSPNGKWACGNYLDAYNNTYAFRWNLESGVIEMLGSDICAAWSVADNGWVGGEWADRQYLGTAAPINLPGVWRDGKWMHMEMPEGNITDGLRGAISPDGRYLAAALCLDGVYTSFVWEDGKLLRDLRSSKGYANVACAISPDGRNVAGFESPSNRVVTIWGPDNQPVYLKDSPKYWQGPWNYARNFSPDGTKMVYWGGWDPVFREGYDPSQGLPKDADYESNWLWAIYDVATGERHKIEMPIHTEVEFNDISNSGLLVGGHETAHATVHDGTKMMSFEDYLAGRGADLDDFDDFYPDNSLYEGKYPVSDIVALSEDENIFGVRYYNSIGQPSSLIVKLDQDLSRPVPVGLEGRQIKGMGTVELTWHNLVGVKGLRGYNIYRDGTKLNTLPLRVEAYYDRNLSAGTYEYSVAAVSAAGVETAAEPVSVSVELAEVAEAPYGMYTRQKGVNSAYAEWSPALSNRLHKHWYDLNSDYLSGFAIYQPMEIEAAIRFDKDEVSAYKGYEIKEVSFIPAAAQKAWGVNFYTYDADGKLQKIGGETIDATALKPGVNNTIELKTPVAMPAGDLVAAISVETDGVNIYTLMTDGSTMKAGYTDLLRAAGDKDFFSCYESSSQSGYEIAYMAWTIDLGLEDASYDATGNALDHYVVSLDGKEVGTTDANNFIVEGLEDGDYTMGVAACYTGGKVSETVEMPVSIVRNTPAVDFADILVGHDGDNSVTARWERPRDNDLSYLSYSKAAKPSMGVIPSGTNFMAGVDLDRNMLRGLDGYRVKTVRFYAMGDAIYTIALYRDGVQVSEVEAANLVVKAWNEVKLPDELVIDSHAEYRITIDVFDPVPDTNMLGIDKAAPYENMSDLYSLDGGKNWNSLTIETGASGNWLIGLTVADPQGELLDVDGYDVIIDGKKANTEMVETPIFVYDLGKLDGKNHTLAIDTWYSGEGAAVEGADNVFCSKKSGLESIDLGAAAAITLRQDGSVLHAEGPGVTSISLVAVDGSLLKTARGNSIGLADIPAGTCIVKVETAGGPAVSRKVVIRK